MSQDPSSSSSKKRKTAGSSTSKDESSTSTSTSTSPTYSDDFNDPEGDVVLQSQDDVPFRLHKFYLQAASTVFRDMLAIPQPPSNQPSSSPPDIKLEDKAEDLSAFLRAVLGWTPLEVDHPDAWPSVKTILTLSNRYGAENLSRNASHAYIADVILEDDFVPPGHHAPHMFPSLIETWALACQQDHLLLARGCLKLFSKNLVQLNDKSRKPWNYVAAERTRYLGLGDLSDEVLNTLSASTIKSFCDVSSAVHMGVGYTWDDAARHFEF